MGMPYPNGSGNHSNMGLGAAGSMNDSPFGMTDKSLQEGLRALFPNVNISMSNGGLNGGTSNGSNNSRMGAFPPGLSGLGNGHQQQQHAHHPQHHSYIQQHQVAQLPANSSSNSSAAASKGWRSSVSDWTCLDPAIVSSGQITDSRSDSPPHWLRSLEQLTETANSPAASHQPPPPLSNTSNPSNLFGLTNSTHYSLPSLVSRGVSSAGLDGLTNSMGSFWPPSVSHATAPSMPPPGFSHIRPSQKTAAASETHKIDSKCCFLCKC